MYWLYEEAAGYVAPTKARYATLGGSTFQLQVILLPTNDRGPTFSSSLPYNIRK